METEVAKRRTIDEIGRPNIKEEEGRLRYNDIYDGVTLIRSTSKGKDMEKWLKNQYGEGSEDAASIGVLSSLTTEDERRLMAEEKFVPRNDFCN